MPSTTQEAVYSVLSAYAGLIALVGDRIYADEAEEGAELPFVVFREISVMADGITHGEYDTDSRLDGVVVQVDAIAADAHTAALVLKQAEDALGKSAYKATVQSGRQLSRDDEAEAHGQSRDFLLRVPIT